MLQKYQKKVFSTTSIKSVQFPFDSEIRIIENKAFQDSGIDSISIPSHVTQIGESAFNHCKNLKKVEIPHNSDLQIIGKNSFSETYIESFTIQPHITIISECAFTFCCELKTIEILPNSELKIIDKNAFSVSSIESFAIPHHLRTIGPSAFSLCYNLCYIEIPINSDLQTIEEGAFFGSMIEKITISKNLVDLKFGWCDQTINVNKIIVSPNNPIYSCFGEKFVIGKSSIENDEYDVLVFCVRNIDMKVIIPSFIKRIESYSFCCCEKLSVIEIPEDSKLQTIGYGAFCLSSVECLTIPSNLTDLQDGWCLETDKLTKIFVSKNNPRYSLYEDKIIIGKSTIENDVYDVLVFSVRNIEKVKIEQVH